jgi:hypothetical protein
VKTLVVEEKKKTKETPQEPIKPVKKAPQENEQASPDALKYSDSLLIKMK